MTSGNHFSQANGSKFDTRTLVLMAALVALQIVFSRFLSIQSPTLRIGFGFVPIVIAAIMFGPIKAGIVAGVSDILGAILFSIGFTPLLTITAVLSGIVFGIFLYRKVTVVKTIIAVLITQVVLSLLLNSYFLFIMYFSGGTTLFAYIMTRVVQTIIMIVIQMIIILALGKILLPKLHLLTSKA